MEDKRKGKMEEEEEERGKRKKIVKEKTISGVK